MTDVSRLNGRELRAFHARITHAIDVLTEEGMLVGSSAGYDFSMQRFHDLYHRSVALWGDHYIDELVRPRPSRRRQP